MSPAEYIDERIHFYEVPKRIVPKQIRLPILKVGDVYIDPNNRIFKFKGEYINMRGATFDMLYAIAKRKGEFAKFKKLLWEVHPDKIHSRSRAWVSVTVKCIRNIMGKDFIINERMNGYKINILYERKL